MATLPFKTFIAATRHSRLLFIAILWVVLPIVCQCKSILTPSDILSFQTMVSTNLTKAIQRLADDVLKQDKIADIFKSSRDVDIKPISPSDVVSMVDEITKQAETKFDTLKSAVINLRDKLDAYLKSSRPPLSGRPPLVQPCCKPRPPNQQMSMNNKVGEYVDAGDVCYGRDVSTLGDGFDLWADHVMDTMKDNFKSIPSVLWQEFALTNGLHVQYPAAKRSCSDSGASNSKLLRSWFKQRLHVGSINLIIMMDASDRMTNKVFRPGSVLPPTSHWDIVKNAAVETLETLLPRDKVTIMTTSGMGVSVPLYCDQTLFSANDHSVHIIEDFLQSVVPNGDPNYVDAFKQAFDLFSGQERLDLRSGANILPSTNILVFMTNGDSIVTQEDLLFQTLKDGQDSILNQVHIQVHAIKQLYIASLSTWLRVADQNNQRLVVNDGRRNVTAAAWTIMKTSTDPVGPMGSMEVMDDIQGFKLSQTVIKTYLNIPNVSMTKHVGAMLVGDDTIQLVTSLPDGLNSPSMEGVVSVNASLSYLFNDVTTFQFGQFSYAFVVDAATGRVIVHPKTLNIFTPMDSKLSFKIFEPDLTSSQIASILSSDQQGGMFSAKVSTGREYFMRGMHGPAMDALVGYRLVEGTRFVICAVIFKSEVKSSTLSSQPLTPAGDIVYHRFDLLPIGISACDLNGTQSSVNDELVGVKFSTEVFNDIVEAKCEETSKKAVNMNAFIQNKAPYPRALKQAFKDDLQNDIKVIHSKEFNDIWGKIWIDPTQRFFGTKAGVLAVQPAMPLIGSLNYKDYAWYWKAVVRLNSTVLLWDTFLGQKHQLLLSKAVQDSERVFGVVGASIPDQILKALIFNEIPMCQRQGLMCNFMDEKGHVFDPSALSISRTIHITHKYPWLANKLLKSKFMKVFWFYSISSNQMTLQYLVKSSPSGISDTNSAMTSSKCREFVLHPITGTNLYILLLADRSLNNCPSESFNPGESCDINTRPSVTSPPIGLPKPPQTPPPIGLPKPPQTPPPIGLPKPPQTPPPIGLPKPPQTPPPIGLPKPPQTPPPIGLPKPPQTPPPIGLPKPPQTPPPIGLPKSPQTPPPIGLPKPPQTPPPIGLPKPPQTPPPIGLPKSPQTPPSSPQTPPSPNGIDSPQTPPPAVAPPPLPPFSQRASLILTLPPLVQRPPSNIISSHPNHNFLSKCFLCPTNSQALTLSCQTPCQCDVVLDTCKNIIKTKSWGSSQYFSIRYELDLSSSPQSIRLHNKQGFPLPTCPKRCSHISDKMECISNSKCNWDDKQPLPICIADIPKTTTIKSRVTSTSASTTNGNKSLTSPSQRDISSQSNRPTQSPTPLSVKGPFTKQTLSSTTTFQNQQRITQGSKSDDSPVTEIAVGGTMGGLSLFVFLLVLFWRLSITHKRLFKRHQISDYPDNLHDGKRFSKDGLIINDVKIDERL